MNAVVLLYYREPHCVSTHLIGACDNFTTANKKIEQLAKEQPDMYSFTSRFETIVVQLFTEDTVR